MKSPIAQFCLGGAGSTVLIVLLLFAFLSLADNAGKCEWAGICPPTFDESR
jgi:hypothetical protein